MARQRANVGNKHERVRLLVKGDGLAAEYARPSSSRSVG
jgi:hypothetical protein